LVHGGQLGAYGSCLAARRLQRAVRVGLRGARIGSRPLGFLRLSPRGLHGGGELGLPRPRGVALGGQLGQLLLERPRALRVDGLELASNLIDPGRTGVVRRRLALGRLQRLELDPAPRRALHREPTDVASPLEPHGDPLECRPRGVHPPGQRLAQPRLRGELLLRALPPRSHVAEQPLRLVAPRPRLRGARLGLDELPRAAPERVARQLEPRLQRLVLDPGMKLRGLGLALQRPQPRAGLALDVQGPRQVVLRALQLQLRAPPPLAVLAEPGRLLDQQPPVARLRVDDRLDAPLRHHRVHLLAEPGVGQDVDDVDEPAARAVEPVLAVAVAVEPTDDR
jgi:hypothetical protein